MSMKHVELICGLLLLAACTSNGLDGTWTKRFGGVTERDGVSDAWTMDVWVRFEDEAFRLSVGQVPDPNQPPTGHYRLDGDTLTLHHSRCLQPDVYAVTVADDTLVLDAVDVSCDRYPAFGEASFWTGRWQRDGT